MSRNSYTAPATGVAAKRAKRCANQWLVTISRVTIDMPRPVEVLLEPFERLPADAKREAAAEIPRRSAALDVPPLDEDDLVQASESVFLELDQKESNHA